MYQHLAINTQGEGLYQVTQDIEHIFQRTILEENPKATGLLFLFIQHTTCALAITEGYDEHAKKDVEECLKRLIPRNLNFISHRKDAVDYSPAHMKSCLLHQHLMIPIEKGKMLLGPWQGIFLAEFKDAPLKRQIFIKFMEE